MSDDVQLVREIGEVKAELSGLKAEVAGTNQRLDDIVITQLKDHGKRIRDLEDHISVMAETCARERGERQGSRTTAIAIITALSGVGGCIGAIVGRMF